MPTPRLGAPEWVAGQALPETTGNEIAAYLEAASGHFIFKDRDLTAPPVSPAQLDTYLVKATATGAWAGHDGDIAVYINTGWVFIEVIDGFVALVVDEGSFIGHVGGAWIGLGLTVDTDTTLASDSTTNPPSVHAVKTAIATAVTGLLDLKGTTDCSGNPNYPAASKGDYYVVTVAGKIGGGSGTTVAVGDVYFATADNAGGTQAAVGASWDVLVHASVAAGGGLLAANNLSDVASPSTAGANIRPVECIIIACSDETTALTAGTSKVTFRMPYAFTVTEVYASLTTAQASGSIFTVDINEAGTSIISTKLTIDNTETDSDTAATPAVISDSSLARRAQMTVDIDQIGDGTAKGLKITLVGHRT